MYEVPDGNAVSAIREVLNQAKALEHLVVARDRARDAGLPIAKEMNEALIQAHEFFQCYDGHLGAAAYDVVCEYHFAYVEAEEELSAAAD